MNRFEDVWPTMHPEGFNFNGQATDYISKCIHNSDMSYTNLSEVETENGKVLEPKYNEFEKTLTPEQQILFNELYNLITFVDNDFTKEQYNRALKLGIKLGVECGSCFGEVGIYNGCD